MTHYSALQLIGIGSLASFCAGMMTFLGALPVIFLRNVSDKLLDCLLGFSAGVMLAATSFSLVLPAISAGGGNVKGALICAMGMVIGGLVLFFSDHIIPHEHFIKGPEGPSSSLRRIWLFIFAISLHNFPEGLAVGVSFGDGSLQNGLRVAIAIGIQNMPEGLAVALALMREKYSLSYSLTIALLSGLIEPVAGVLGISVVTLAQSLLPWGLAFAAGAMLWVISHEIIPETHRRGFEKYATSGLMVGFILMMILDNVTFI